MAHKILEIKNLSHRYAVDWAIRDINLSIEDKGVVGLLGSNGAGKSTTMNIVCGVLYQTEGEVWLNGVNMRENPRLAKRFLGFLPQKAPLFPELSVDEYLYHCAAIRQVPHARICSAIQEAKEKCGLDKMGHRLIRHLSGGYQQRVGIAQAIIHSPLLVILDEPTNGLDPNQILGVRSLIKEIAKDCVVLISTHILPEVQAICDRIEMIEHGRLVFSGDLDTFCSYSAPSTIMTTMETPPEDAVLASLSGVERIERITDKCVRLHFSGVNGEELVNRLVGDSAAGGWGISEIYVEKQSLDTVFAKLSGK